MEVGADLQSVPTSNELIYTSTVLTDMKLIYILPLYFLLACNSSKELNETEPTVIYEESPSEIIVSEDDPTLFVPAEIPIHNIEIAVSHYTPYCGGAAPSQEIIAQQHQISRNASFILLNLETMEKTYVQTNDKGILYLNLPKGRYALRELSKDCSYAEFVEKNPPQSGNYLVPSPDSDCYKTWWLSNLGEFEISNPAALQVFAWGTGARCFTGNNPCVEYIGPYPP